MFRWTDDMIRYMADAGRQTDFHRRLTAELLPYLSPQDRVCDAGCGLGFLSLALAPHVRHVMAADCDAQALSVLKEELAARHTPADMAALQALQRQAEQAAQEGTDALAEALFRYHRGITFLSGNTITPLLFNAFTRVNLEFWKEYIQLTGIDRCLERLAQFTAHIEAGEGQAASSLLRQGLEQFITQVR